MNASPVFGKSGVSSGLTGWGQIASRLAVMFMLLFGAAGAAVAGVGIAVTPTFPSALTPGQTNLPASLLIGWTNAGIPYDAHADIISGVNITPSCGAVSAASGANCQAQFVETGNPITLSTTGTGSDGCRRLDDPTQPVGTFTITPPTSPGGPYLFAPDFLLPVGGACTITFSANVVSIPTKDANGTRSGTQTAVLAGATAADAEDPRQTASGAGTALLSFPVITTLQSDDGTLGDIPVLITDTAKIVGLVPSSNDTTQFPPSGTVTFKLYAPADANCTGAPFATEVTNLSTPGQCSINSTSMEVNCQTSGTYAANAAGVWHWTALYSGDALNPSVFSGCAAEPVAIGKATPTLATVPQPQSGTRLVTPLGDQAELAGGFDPKGTITFSLYPPSQFINGDCAGNPIFVNTISVNGNSVYDTSASAPASLINETGTYYWKAVYSGDANNNAVTHACINEPVVIDAPTIRVTKTPDAPGVGSQINAGSDAVFTIVVTNDGPGAAANVQLTDTLPSAFAWTIQSVSGPNPNACSITGTTLNCSFGTLEQGQTRTVIVKAPTTAALCTPPAGSAEAFVRISNPVARATASNAAPVQDAGAIDCLPPRIIVNKTPDGGSGAPGVIVAGEAATFTIVVTNNGVGVANDVVLSDVLPSAFSWSVQSVAGTPTSPAANVCSITGTTLTCNYGALNPGDTRTVVVTAPTTAALCTPPAGSSEAFVRISNPVAQATSSNAAPAQDSGFINCNPPKITVVKSPDGGTSAPGLIDAGDNATFTIVVSNNGTGAAMDVVLNDVLPAGFSWTVQSVSGTPTSPNANVCSINAGTLNCVFGTLNPGETRTVVVNALTTLALCTPAAGSATAFVRIPNPVAQATSSNAGSAQDSGFIDCRPPRLIVEKTPDATGNVGVINAGDLAKFTIVVSNAGPGTAKTVQLTDVLPAGFTWTIVSVDGSTQPGNICSIAAGTLTCNFGDMAVGTAHTVILSAPTTVESCTPAGGNGQGTVTIANPVARATASNALPAQDAGSIVCASPNLTVSKSPDNATYKPGDTLNFNIVVSNSGPGVAKNVRLSPPDALPDPNKSLQWGPAAPVVTCTGQSAAAASCAVSGIAGSQVLNCNFGDMVANASCSVMVSTATQTQDVDPLDCGTANPLVLNNTATVVADNSAPKSDSASQSCQVDQCEIGVDKTCSTAPVSTSPFQCVMPEAFTVQWDPTLSTDPKIAASEVVDLRIWNGAIGSQASLDVGDGPQNGAGIVCNVLPGDVVTVSGLAGKNGKKQASTHYWEVFKHDPACDSVGFTPTAANKLGNSAFDISCSDTDMNNPEDCGKPAGDMKGTAGLLNNFRFAGWSGPSSTIGCDVPEQNCEIPRGGAKVTYQYKVTNKGAAPVVVNVVDDKKTNGPVASNVTIPNATTANPTQNVQTFKWETNITQTTTNTVTVTGNPGPNQCVATDKTTVTVQTLGEPMFVIGDRTPHQIGTKVNFWGAQWWKNNSMSGFVAKGAASFKGYATEAGYCGDPWKSRVGNSAPPPQSIPKDVVIIVTDTVWKDGPDEGGNIKALLVVREDGGYGPNPGHRGSGPVVEYICCQQPGDNGKILEGADAGKCAIPDGPDPRNPVIK